MYEDQNTLSQVISANKIVHRNSIKHKPFKKTRQEFKHQCSFSYKQRYIAGSAKCSIKPLSQILTRILTAVKEDFQKYCDTAYARSGVNQMWILKNFKELLENLKAQSLYSVNSIKSFDFSTLYTTIPHDKLKSELKEIINKCFFHKNGNR